MFVESIHFFKVKIICRKIHVINIGIHTTEHFQNIKFIGINIMKGSGKDADKKNNNNNKRNNPLTVNELVINF